MCGSLISRCMTPQVKAPCDPPPCRARLMRFTPGFSRRGCAASSMGCSGWLVSGKAACSVSRAPPAGGQAAPIAPILGRSDLRCVKVLVNRRLARSGRSRAGDATLGGEDHGHLGADADVAFEFQPAAVKLHQLLAQRQAEAGAFVFALQRSIHLTE